jgi:hypothetical protein
MLIIPVDELALSIEKARFDAESAATRGKDPTWMSDAEVLEHLGPLGGQVRRMREGA